VGEAAAVEVEVVLAATGAAMPLPHMVGGEVFPHAVGTEVATGAAPEDMLHIKGTQVDLTATQEDLLVIARGTWSFFALFH